MEGATYRGAAFFGEGCWIYGKNQSYYPRPGPASGMFDFVYKWCALVVGSGKFLILSFCLPN